MAPARLSHEQKIARLIGRKAEALATQAVTCSKLRVILHDCGWQKRGSGNLVRIQAALEAAGIYPEPMLTAPRLARDELIYFTREKPEPYYPEWYAPSQTFTTERALKRFLIENFQSIAEFSDLKEPELEFELPSGKFVDILCRERGTDAYVVIEVKKRDKDPVGQLEKYLVEVRKDLAGRGPERIGVKGILITGAPNAALERSLPECISDFEVKWFLYRVELRLHKRSESRARVVRG